MGLLGFRGRAGDPSTQRLHVMAQAVKRLFPEARITIGPAIKDGFYYDFDLEHRFSPEDFPRIEEKMQEIIAQNLPISVGS